MAIYCTEDEFVFDDQDDGFAAIDWGSWAGVVTGPQGEKGDTGPVYTPHISSSGVLTWTNNGGLPNPPAFALPPSSDMYFQNQTVSAASGQIMRIPASGTNAGITTNTIVLECSWANPSAITTDVSWTSYSGYIVFSGTCTSATTANVVLGQKNN